MADMDVKADAEVAKAQERAGGDVEQELIGRLVDQAREQGVDLVGGGGLLRQLTKRVLESAAGFWRCRWWPSWLRPGASVGGLRRRA